MKKSQLRKIIRESLKGLMTEQLITTNCSNRLCVPKSWGASQVNHYHKWADPTSVPSFQHANFADYRFRGGGGICGAPWPLSWRWFDAIVLNPATAPNSGPGSIGPNPPQPNWASMVTYLQGLGVPVTLAMTGQQVNLAAIAALQTSGIIVPNSLWPGGPHMGVCSNNPCPPPCGTPPTAEEGCGVPQALNYNECCNGDPNCVPTTLVDNCCEFPDPDWGWNCEQIGDHWKFGHHCVPGTYHNQGQYATQQDCQSAPCSSAHNPIGIDMGGETGGFTPLTTDPQDMVKPEDEMKRMQKLANIKS